MLAATSVRGQRGGYSCDTTAGNTDIDSELDRSFHHAITAAPTAPCTTATAIQLTLQFFQFIFFTVALQLSVGKGFLIVEDSRSYSDTPH